MIKVLIDMFLIWNIMVNSAWITKVAAGSTPGKIFLPFILAPIPPVLLAAGDIASCTSDGDEATAALIATMSGMVAALGDNAYEDGSLTDYSTCYVPTWGSFIERTQPTPGNHDYNTPNAGGYYQYYGALAGDSTQGYYSYDLGSWHIIVVNSNCADVGGCRVGGPQETWLRDDLAKHPAQCTLAYWHHPLFSSGQNGGFTSLVPIWQALYDNGADVVLTAHDHDYERFAPQDANGHLDLKKGLVEFVVGTGGKQLTDVNPIMPNSQVFNNVTYGVLRLELKEGSYSWQFLPVAGGTFTDSGSQPCH